VNYTVSMTVLSVESRHRPTRHSLGHFGDRYSGEWTTRLSCVTANKTSIVFSL